MTRTLAPTLGLAALAAFSSFTAPNATRAQSYTVTDLGALTGSQSEGESVNNSGQVTGIVTLSQNHAFLYSNGKMTNLGTIGGDYSQGAAINTSGQVVGSSTNGSYDSDFNSLIHAFRYSGGGLADLGTLGGDNSFGYGINASGEVTGNSDTRSGVVHAFLYSGGQMTDIGTLGGTSSVGNAINSNGQITGYSSTAGNAATHAFLYSNGTMTDIGTLGQYSVGNGINDSGQITGYAGTPGNAHAFLYSNGQMKDLGTLPGTTSSSGDSINSAGQVVGYSGSGDHAFLYTNGTLVDLNTRIPSASGWVLKVAHSISDTGFITGGGTHNGKVRAFLLTPLAPALSIASLSPDTVDVGHAAFAITVNGTKFVPTTVVRYNGQTLTTSYVSSTQVTASVPASLVAQTGTADITVQTPGVATSGAAPFHVRPVISSLSPSTTAVSAGTFTLTVNGAGFTSNSIVVFNGTNLVTRYVSASKLTATVPASLLTVGRKSVMVTIPHVATSRGAAFVVTP